MLNKSKILAMAFAVLPFFASAGIDLQEITVDGYGTSRELAQANGLVEATRQVLGVSIESEKMMRVMQTRLASSTDGASTHTVDMGEVSAQRLGMASRGYIKTYRIDSLNQEDDGLWHARVVATIATYKTDGIPPESRRRIAAIPFKVIGKVYYGNGELSPSRISEDVFAEINRMFTQSRRFAVLSRADSAVIKAEKQLLLEESPIEELGKIGQTLGCDYIITGTIKDFYIAPSAVTTIKATGRSFLTISRAMVTATYRIIVPATSQIKWADTVTVDLTAQELAMCQGDIVTAYDTLLNQLISGISKAMDNIYPMRLISATEDGLFIINEGGPRPENYTFFDVFKLGEMLYNPSNNEPLARPETHIGIIKIERSDAKLSYASLYSGNIDADMIGDGNNLIVRPHRYTDEELKTLNQGTSTQKKSGVKLPFDR